MLWVRTLLKVGRLPCRNVFQQRQQLCPRCWNRLRALQPPGMWLGILEETFTRASWENGPSIHTLVPSTNFKLQVLRDHRRISTAVCIRRRGTEAEKARADYRLAFDLSLAPHVGIYEFHCQHFFFPHLFIRPPQIHPSEWTADLSRAWQVSRSAAVERPVESSCLVTRQMLLIFKDRVLVHVVEQICFFSCALSRDKMGDSVGCGIVPLPPSHTADRVQRNPLTVRLLIHIPKPSILKIQ